MFGNNVLRLESATCDNSITVSECIGSTPVSPTEWCCFDVSFDASRKAAGPVDVAAETSYAERITHETGKRDRSLQMRVKVRHAEACAILRHPLIESGISADRLFCSQRRIAKTHEPDLRESACAESLKQRRRAETVAYMRAQLCVGGANEIGDRAIAGNRVVRIDCVEKSRTIGRANAEPLTTRCK